MAQHFSQPWSGAIVASLRQRRSTVTTLSVDFDIPEIVDMSEEYAFTRTVSAGQPQLKFGYESAEANQKLFVLRTEDLGWEIARYFFCSSLLRY